MSGNWIQIVAQAWLVLTLTRSGTALGVLASLQFLPLLFLAPYGGVIADRFSKRKLLYITQTALGVLTLILGLLVATGTIQLWMLYVLAACVGIVNSFDNPVRQSFVYEMVGKAELRNAITLNTGLANLCRVIGPAIAAALIATVGMASCFIINAFTFCAVIVALAFMRQNELQEAPVAAKKGQLIEGFRYVLNTPVLFNSLLMMAIIGTLTYEFTISLPLIADFTFHGSATTYAILSAAFGIGAVAGGLVTASQKKSSQKMLVISALLFGLTVLITSIMPNLSLAVVALFFVGISSIIFLSLASTILQIESKPELRGRVMAFWTIAFLGSTTVGGPVIGYVGQHAGPRWALALGGFAAIAAGLIGAWNLRKKRV